MSIDGGGVRGLLALQVLRRIESVARDLTGNSDLRLCDCFDFIAGTSTGGIIAAALSIGLSVDQIEAFYLDNAEAMFARNSSLIKRLTTARYETAALQQKLQEVFGHDTLLGSDRLRTLLMLVMLNASTSSPWPVSNNPMARFNEIEACGPSSNLHLPLWQLVRASAAAPFYFEPESITLEGREFLFFDGGITPYNNPAFKLFQMATLPQYRLNWPTGEKQMLLVSVGTGLLPKDLANETSESVNFIKALPAAVQALMYTSSTEQDLLCRSLSKVVAGDPIDMEVGDLIGSSPIGGRALFTYARYNADLSPRAMAASGLSFGDEVTFSLDNLASIGPCIEIGTRLAERVVKPEHLTGFLRPFR